MTRLGNQSLRGYLSGSVDAVLRIRRPRYLVVDYKTNWLGDGDRPLTSADYDRPRLAEAMLHSDYPLQALLYTVVLHRFLRWRQPGLRRRCAIWAACCICSCGACAGRTRRWSTGIRRGCSAGSRRRRWSWRCRTCSMRGGRRRDDRTCSRRRGCVRAGRCACGATSDDPGRRSRRTSSAGCRTGGAGAARRIGVRGSAVGGEGVRDRGPDWRRSRPAHYWASRRSCD